MAVNFNKLKQEILEEHNKVRRDPKSYIPVLNKILGYFKGDVIYKPGQVGIQTDEGQAVYKETIKFLEKQAPLGTLILNENISKAAQDHCEDIGPKGLTDHDGSDGSTVTDRIEKYLEWDKTVAENLDFGGKTGEEVIVSLIVDDGNPDRGHRMTIFNGDLKYIGIGLGKHETYEVCTTLDYVGAIKKEHGKAKTKDLGGLEAPEETNAHHPLDTRRTEREDPPVTRNLARELRINVPSGEFLFGKKHDIEEDKDKPEGAVGVKIRTTVKKRKGKVHVLVTKTFLLEDGSLARVELEEELE